MAVTTSNPEIQFELEVSDTVYASNNRFTFSSFLCTDSLYILVHVDQVGATGFKIPCPLLISEPASYDNNDSFELCRFD